MNTDKQTVLLEASGPYSGPMSYHERLGDALEEYGAWVRDHGYGLGEEVSLWTFNGFQIKATAIVIDDPARESAHEDIDLGDEPELGDEDINLEFDRAVNIRLGNMRLEED